MVACSSGPMHPISVGRASPHRSAPFRDGHGTFRFRHRRFRAARARPVPKTAKPTMVGGPNCPFSRGRKLELKIKSGRILPRRTERRQSTPDVRPRYRTARAERPGQRLGRSPEQCGPIHPPKKEHVFAGEEFRSSVRSDAQTVTEKRRVGVNTNDFCETFEHPRDETAS